MQTINKNIVDIDIPAEKLSFHERIVTPPVIIAHVCNCRHKMNAGVAKAIARKWPIVKEGYMKEPELRLGTNLGYYISPNFFIVNMLAQDNYGNAYVTGNRYLNYGALARCLSELNRFAGEQYTAPNIYLPYKMGCGLAGGDWDIVQELIQFSITYGEVLLCKI